MDLIYTSTTKLPYPHEKLNESLNNYNVKNCQRLAMDLLGKINELPVSDEAFLNFYSRCLMIDILMFISEALNRNNILFADYSDIYFNLFERKVAHKMITRQNLYEYIMDSYCDPNFSLAMLADNFHISTSAMSRVVTELLNENFSTFLWELRQKKHRNCYSTQN